MLPRPPQTPSRAASPRRAGVALALAASGLLGLTACDKPTPGVTVVSGTDRGRTDAVCYDRDGGAVQASSCNVSSGSAPVVTLAQDGAVGIDVDPIVADSGGWQASIAGQNAFSGARTTTFARFYLNESALASGPVTLRIDKYAKDGHTIQGVWAFRIEKAS